MEKGVLLIISGPSGSGKGTIVERLVDDLGYRVSISATTRNPRPNEENGVHYFFKTKEEIALTGASEHHTGLAVDIVGKNHQGLDKSQASTKEAIWLNEHAAEYGFILRFPQDKVEITGISYESWHFRYVGEEASKFMKENNLCLEEFVELAKAQQEQEALKEAEME